MLTRAAQIGIRIFPKSGMHKIHEMSQVRGWLSFFSGEHAPTLSLSCATYIYISKQEG